MIKKILKKSLAVLFLICAAFLAESCVSKPQINPEQEELFYPQSSYIPQTFEWQKISKESSIEYSYFENKSFPIIYHLVKIDLQNKNLKLITFPDKNQTNKKFKSKKTKTFAKENELEVAINASPFEGRIGSTRQIVGIHKTEDFQLSEPIQKYSALAFKKSENGYIAKIITNQIQNDFESYNFAFGGFFTILENGEPKSFIAATHDSRTAAGLSQDGKTLFLLVVEGERKNKSEGLSYQQCAKIFKSLGCKDALEFDGGGSSELCINAKSVLTYQNFRIQANSFGFKTK